MPDREAGFELLTPRGHGGVAVVGVRGEDRWARVREFVAASEGGRGPQLGELRCDGVIVDEVLLVDRPAAQILEIHLHGSPAVVRAFERAAGGFAIRPVGRADRLLREAHSREQLGLALEQQALDIGVFLDASPSRAAVGEALARSRFAMALAVPRRLVICGDQNAGKSTLMNRLLFRERVITGDFPGLTRDPVREGTLLDGYPYEVVDTAGEGPVDRGEAPEIDQRALSLARRERREGLLLLVADGSRPPSASDRNIRNQHTLVVRSKSDLPAAKWPEDFPSDVTVCCTAPDSASVVRRGVGEALRRLRNLPPAGPVGGVAALSGEELSRLEVARGEFGTGYSPPPV